MFKENKCSLHAVSKRTREKLLFNGNIQGYRYLLTEELIQAAIAIKAAYMSSRKRDLIEFMKHTYTFEKMKSHEIHKIYLYLWENII